VLSAFCDGTVFGERLGSNAPQVLALHGWRKDHTDLSEVVTGFDAIALDLAGHGATPEPPVGWGSDDYARSIEKLLDEFPTPPVVFGHSFGGRVAIHLAAAHPDRIRALVLTGTPMLRKPSSKKPALAFRLAKWAYRMHLLSDSQMEAQRRRRGSADYRAAQGVMRDTFVKLVNESYEPQLRAITCPVELVWGEKDTEAGLWQAQEANEMLKNGKLTVVPGGSHWLTHDNPQVLREAIERSLA
jgi:pimeloyl-ACP methyl ester carboxylesterase